MIDLEIETPEARIHDAAASGGAGIVILAVIVAAQMIVALGVVLDHVLDHRFDLWLNSITRR